VREFVDEGLPLRGGEAEGPGEADVQGEGDGEVAGEEAVQGRICGGCVGERGG